MRKRIAIIKLVVINIIVVITKITLLTITMIVAIKVITIITIAILRNNNIMIIWVAIIAITAAIETEIEIIKKINVTPSRSFCK